MPRVVKTTDAEAMRLLRLIERQHLENALAHIALSALDDSDSGADTAAVVYEQLAKLGIVVP